MNPTPPPGWEETGLPLLFPGRPSSPLAFISPASPPPPPQHIPA